MAQQAGEHRVRPLRRDAEMNRQRILRAASQVFTARGLQATLDDVARQAGVGVGTVYRRFPDKEALVDALFEDKLQALVTEAERALEAPDSWTGLVTLLNTGTNVGAFCNLLPAGGLLPKNIPSFCSWWKGRLRDNTEMNNLLQTAAEVMRRRGVTCSEVHAALYRLVMLQTAGERHRTLAEADRRQLRRSA